MEKIAEVLMNWVKIHLKQLKTGRAPHISFILSKIISHPTSYGLVSNLKPSEILKLAYVVFFMFEGDDYNTAKEKSEQVQVIEVVEINDITEKLEDCDYCDGSGEVECQVCNGYGEVTCYVCDGDGTSEDGNENCKNCGGSGNETCTECYGGTEVDCQNCEGNGTVESYEDEIIQYGITYWAVYTPFFVEFMDKKLQDDSINTDFYTDADSEGTFGDLTIISSKSSLEMDKSDWEMRFSSTKINDSMVSDITPFNNWPLKNELKIINGGTKIAMTKI